MVRKYVPGPDHSDPFERLFGMAVDPYTSRMNGSKDHVVDEQGNLVVPGPDVAELARIDNSQAGTSDPEERFHSNFLRRGRREDDRLLTCATGMAT